MCMLYVRLNLCRTGALAALLALGPGVAAAAPPTTTQIVKLITGDRVAVDSAGSTVVHPSAGRQSVSFEVKKVNGHTHVVPSDALPLLRAGKLDPRLFDVTELTASGYHKRAATPVIMTGVTGGTANTYGPAGRSLKSVQGVALRAATDGSFWHDWTATRGTATYSAGGATGTGKLWLDARRKLTVENNIKQIGGDVAHERGFLGDGVKVAVLDSGIDRTHPDLKGQVAEHKNFVEDEEDDRDYVGHGTHVASTIAGTGELSGGKYQGVAPHATLLDAKACGVNGCPESSILAAAEWAAEEGARIINVSLGSTDTPGEDLVEEAVNKLSKEYGVLFVVSAGNDFVFGFTVGSPASAEAALAVGSLNESDLPSDFSNRGLLGDVAVKPEIVAPGEQIVAARSNFMENGPPTEIEGYLTASGTSMAAPHVSGAAALLSQAHPSWKGDRLKAVLMGSAKILDEQSVLEQGAGLVYIPTALDLEVHASPAAVSFGRQSWPHDDDKAIERSIKLHNSSDKDVTLDLKVEARGPAGADAAGLVKLDQKQVKIAAHADAEVSLTADTRKVDVDGLYSAALIATSDRHSLHVPLVIDREVESYDLSFKFVARTEDPSLLVDNSPDVINADPSSGSPWNFVRVEEDGTAKIRLARGKYTVTNIQFAFEDLGEDPPPDANGRSEATTQIYPYLLLDRDTEVVFDARQAKQVKVGAPLEDALETFLALTYSTKNFSTGLLMGGENSALYSGRVGPDGPLEEVSTTLAATWVETEEGLDSKYQINWAKLIPDELITGYKQRTKLEEYAQVDTKFARGGADIEASFFGMAIPSDPEAGFSSSAVGIQAPLPGERTLYYYASDPALAWRAELSQTDFENNVWDSYEETLLDLKAGECTEQLWNQAVFGPAPGTGSGSGFFGPSVQRRLENTLYISPPLLADGAGRIGITTGENSKARLFREGELIEEAEGAYLSAEVGAGDAKYRAEFELDRSSYAELSTKIALSWEFSSAASGTPQDPDQFDSGTPLDVSYIRFLPKLNEQSAAPQDAVFKLPIRVEPQPESEGPAAESLTVDVSYDDGKTWDEVDVSGGGADWTVKLEHPQQSGYVSLRASSIDADDNLVEVTIIRAYRLE
jgi:subtilisin family serine protease